MSQSFSFPPPPPPPPKRDSQPTDIRGGFRGRGNGRGHDGRSGGQPLRGRDFRGHQTSQRGRGNVGQKNTVQKRDFSTAFTNQAQSRPRAPPAVPSFNADLDNLLPKKLPATTAVPVKHKNNLLGLTPSPQGASDSEDDVDEEGKLAKASADGLIQFEHRGQTLILRTSDEIAAWIAERKKRFPTKAKVEAAKREAAERKKQWEERKRAREAALQIEREARAKARKERERQQLKDKMIAAHIANAKVAAAGAQEDATLKAREKAERLKKKVEKATRELQIAEEELRGSQPANDGTEASQNSVVDDDNQSVFSSEMAEAEEVDDTSSSGSSDTDSASETASRPEEMTSRPTGPERVAPARQDRRKDGSEERGLCKSMVKYGRCKFGRKCRFSHKVQKEKKARPSVETVRRKGLYEVMVAKERDEELRQALRAIITLGERGILNPPEAIGANAEEHVQLNAENAAPPC